MVCHGKYEDNWEESQWFRKGKKANEAKFHGCISHAIRWRLLNSFPMTFAFVSDYQSSVGQCESSERCTLKAKGATVRKARAPHTAQSREQPAGSENGHAELTGLWSQWVTPVVHSCSKGFVFPFRQKRGGKGLFLASPIQWRQMYTHHQFIYTDGSQFWLHIRVSWRILKILVPGTFPWLF